MYGHPLLIVEHARALRPAAASAADSAPASAAMLVQPGGFSARSQKPVKPVKGGERLSARSTASEQQPILDRGAAAVARRGLAGGRPCAERSGPLTAGENKLPAPPGNLERSGKIPRRMPSGERPAMPLYRARSAPNKGFSALRGTNPVVESTVKVEGTDIGQTQKPVGVPASGCADVPNKQNRPFGVVNHGMYGGSHD